jgi:hypothetical protein
MSMIVFGQIGALNNWIISPVRALQSAFVDSGIVPGWVKKDQPEASLKRLLWLQAGLVLIFCLCYYQIKAEQVYHVFNMLLVLLYMPMYVIVLLAMVYDRSGPSVVFGQYDSKALRWLVASMGILSSICVFLFTIGMKPDVFSDQSNLQYYTLVLLPWLLCFLVPLILSKNSE